MASDITFICDDNSSFSTNKLDAQETYYGFNIKGFINGWSGFAILDALIKARYLTIDLVKYEQINVNYTHEISDNDSCFLNIDIFINFDKTDWTDAGF